MDLADTAIDSMSERSGAVILRPKGFDISTGKLSHQFESFKGNLCSPPPNLEDPDEHCCHCDQCECEENDLSGEAAEQLLGVPSKIGGMIVFASPAPKGGPASGDPQADAVELLETEPLEIPDEASLIDYLKQLQEAIQRMELQLMLPPSPTQEERDRINGLIGKAREHLIIGDDYAWDKFGLHAPAFEHLIEPQLAPTWSKEDLAAALQDITTPGEMKEDIAKDRTDYMGTCCLLEMRGTTAFGKLGEIASMSTHEGKHGGIHCWLNMRDLDGKYWVLQGFSMRVAEGWNWLQGYLTPNAWKGGGAKFYLKGLNRSEICKYVTRLTDEAVVIRPFIMRWQYRILGPNSSTFLAEAMKNAGLLVSSPSVAIGWDNEDRLLKNRSFAEWKKREKAYDDSLSIELGFVMPPDPKLAPPEPPWYVG